MLFTSNFKTCGRHPLAVAISNGTRGYGGIKTYPALRPEWSTVKAHNSGAMVDAAFEDHYGRILAKLDPEKVVADLKEMNVQVMLCWEPVGAFCHRRLVALWLESRLGILVPEYDPVQHKLDGDMVPMFEDDQK